MIPRNVLGMKMVSQADRSDNEKSGSRKSNKALAQVVPHPNTVDSGSVETVKEKLKYLKSQKNLHSSSSSSCVTSKEEIQFNPKKQWSKLIKQKLEPKALRRQTVKKEEVNRAHRELVTLFSLRKTCTVGDNIDRIDTISKSKPAVKKRPVLIIRPNSGYLRAWYLILGAIISFQAMYIPFVVSFSPDIVGTIWELLDDIFDAMFVVDIIIHFNIGYYNDTATNLGSSDKQKFIEWNRAKIAKKYIKGWFWIDLLAVIPFHKFFSDDINSDALGLFKGFRLPRLLGLLRLLRVLKMMRVKGKAIHWIQYSKIVNILRLCRMMSFILCIVHLICCGWYVVSVDNEWGNAHYTKGDLATNYVKSFYYSLMMVLGEEIGPVTIGEMSYVSFSIIVGAVIMAIIFGNVAVLVSNMCADSTRYNDKLTYVFQSMQKLGLPAEVQNRVQEYYSYIWENFHCLDGNKANFMDEISPNLKMEIDLYLNAKMIRNVPLLQECSPEIVQKLVAGLTIQIYLPHDYIVKCGEIGHDMFFVQRGECNIIITKTSKFTSSKSPIIKTICAGDYFGEIAMMMACKRTATVRARTFAVLATLHRDNFVGILSSYKCAKDKMERLILERYNSDERKPEPIYATTKENCIPTSINNMNKVVIDISKSLNYLNDRFDRLEQTIDDLKQKNSVIEHGIFDSDFELTESSVTKYGISDDVLSDQIISQIDDNK